MNQMPILIPYETKRDCITVANKVYCEAKDVTHAQIGWVIIGAIALISWLCFLFYLYIELEYNPALVFGLGFALPTIVIGLALVMS